MAINKNFVIKNGLEVNTNVLVAASDEQQVGVGTTRPYYKLHVGGGEGNRGGIGATDITITGIATIGVANSESGAFRVLGISTFQGDLDLLGSAGVSTVRWDASKDALTFVDNASARFGTGEDLQIWHDGTNSYISDKGDGSLIIGGTDETLAVFTDDGSIQLYHNNTKVFETTGLGVTSYGDVVVAGVTTSARLNVTGVSTLATNTTIDTSSVNVSTGATITTGGNAAFAGIVTANGGLKVGTAVTVDANTGNVAVSGILTVGGNLSVTGDITYDEVTGRNLNITGIGTFVDDAPLYFGDSQDLTIKHEAGGHSYIKEASGAGSYLYIDSNRLYLRNGAANESLANFIEDGPAQFYYDNTLRLETTGIGATVHGDFIASGVGTFARANVTGIATVGILSVTENARIAGIVTADRFVGIHTSADGGGIGIGSTSAHVGYGFTYIDFKGPGVSTVYASSVTGITTIYFQGGGGSSVGAAGTWQNDGAQGISTAKSVGINTVGVAVTALQGGEKGASSGIGQTFQGLYISNGMVVNDNQLNGNHYIGTAFGGVMAGPVTVNGVITVDGNWAVV